MKKSKAEYQVPARKAFEVELANVISAVIWSKCINILLYINLQHFIEPNGLVSGGVYLLLSNGGI